MYAVDIVNRGGYCFTVESKGYEFSVDMKGAQGVTPPDALLASLGSCIGVYIRKYIEGAGLSLAEFKVSVDADFDKTGAPCFKEINVNVELKGINLDARRLNAMLEFVKKCPVHNTLKSNPEVQIKINLES